MRLRMDVTIAGSYHCRREDSTTPDPTDRGRGARSAQHRLNGLLIRCEIDADRRGRRLRDPLVRDDHQRSADQSDRIGRLSCSPWESRPCRGTTTNPQVPMATPFSIGTGRASGSSPGIRRSTTFRDLEGLNEGAQRLVLLRLGVTDGAIGSRDLDIQLAILKPWPPPVLDALNDRFDINRSVDDQDGSPELAVCPKREPKLLRVASAAAFSSGSTTTRPSVLVRLGTQPSATAIRDR